MKTIATFDSLIVDDKICRTQVQSAIVLGFAWHGGSLDDNGRLLHGCSVAFVLNENVLDGRALTVPVRDCKFDVFEEPPLKRSDA